MARLFVFGIGGTGLRVMKSLTMLLASGMKPGNFDEVIPLLIDPHKELPEYTNCKTLISLYSHINSKLYPDDSKISDGFFRVKFRSLKATTDDKSLTNDVSFDEGSTEEFGKFIDLIGLKDISPSTVDFLSLLYSDANFNQPLSVGFKGNPHMGSIALNAIIGGPAYNAFVSTFGKDDRIFIISSVFGGTGAAGFPLLLQNFRSEDMANKYIKKSQIGALSVMPYFKLSEPDLNNKSEIDSNDFMAKTKSALTYYTREDFTKLYNAMYYIADPDKQSDPYENNEKKQNNKAHLVELLGALSIFHFAKNSFSDGEVHEYVLEDKNSIDFKTIGSSSKKLFGGYLTGFHLFSKLHQVVKSKCNSLPFCKTNNFNADFFNGDFFTEKEGGLEIFFDLFYKPWISELSKNQRGFAPYDLSENKNEKKHKVTFDKLLNGHPLDHRNWGGIFRIPRDMSDLLKKMAVSSLKPAVKQISEENKCAKYIQTAYLATGDFISHNFKIFDHEQD